MYIKIHLKLFLKIEMSTISGNFIETISGAVTSILNNTRTLKNSKY